jgi:phosphoglycolate phosphatase
MTLSFIPDVAAARAGGADAGPGSLSGPGFPSSSPSSSGVGSRAGSGFGSVDTDAGPSEGSEADDPASPGNVDKAVLAELLNRAQCVMFDFDGPLADLFSGLKAPEVARVLRERVASWSAAGPVAGPAAVPTLTSPDDPHQILLDVAGAYRTDEYRYRVAELDKLLTEQEARAATSAEPTAEAAGLVRRMVERGKSVAITTNNAVDAVGVYLRQHEIESLFRGRIHGRPADPLLMKPVPTCLAEALRSTGATAQESLMIGDSLTDFAAANALGISFLGYAKGVRKRRQLSEAGVRTVVGSFDAVLELA